MDTVSCCGLVALIFALMCTIFYMHAFVFVCLFFVSTFYLKDLFSSNLALSCFHSVGNLLQQKSLNLSFQTFSVWTLINILKKSFKILTTDFQLKVKDSFKIENLDICKCLQLIRTHRLGDNRVNYRKGIYEEVVSQVVLIFVFFCVSQINHIYTPHSFTIQIL